MPDYYAILGVARDAGPEEVKRAYRRLARELHPDVNPSPDAQERIKQVNAAYEVLSDPDKRRVHDLGGDPLGPSGGAGPGNPFGSFTGFGDIMDAFFGTSAPRGPRSRVRQGADALIRLDLELAETAMGAQREITVDTAVVCATCSGTGCAPGTSPQTCATCKGRGDVQSVQRSFLGQVMTSRPCPACGGTGQRIAHPCVECSAEGRVRSRRALTVNVPPGIADGMRLRLSGEGEVGPGGGPPGDLYVEVRERPHPVFTRDGDDLHCTVVLPMTAAALGTGITLDLLDGTEDLTIPGGSQPASVLTLRGRGVSHLQSHGRGDVIVHLDVRVPTRLDGEQQRLLAELASVRGEERPAVAGTAAADRGGSGLFGRRRGKGR